MRRQFFFRALIRLVDDALDYLGDQGHVGKATLADLREGKVTFPVLQLSGRLSHDENKFLDKVLDTRSTCPEDMVRIAEFVRSYGTDSETLLEANRFTARALSSLDLFHDSTARSHLMTIAGRLLSRGR